MHKIQIQIGVSERSKAIVNRTAFNTFANVIASFYERLIDKKINGLRKITLELFSEKDVFFIGDYKKLLSVCLIDKSFDFEYFGLQDKQARQKIILDTLQESVIAMCHKFELETVVFERAYTQVMQANYENKFILGKITSSTDKKHKAEVEIDMNETGAAINVLFTDPQGNLQQKKKIFQTAPNYFFVYQIVNEGKWLNENEYLVSNKSKTVNFKISLSEDKVDLFFNPNNQHSAKEYYNKLLTLDYNGSIKESLQFAV